MSHPVQLRRRARQRAKRRRENWEAAWHKPGVSAQEVLATSQAYMPRGGRKLLLRHILHNDHFGAAGLFVAGDKVRVLRCPPA